MEFRILGPLQVRAADRELNLGGLRSQRILALLLLNPNRVVTVSHLAEAAWEEAPPATARRQVQNRIAALRAMFTREGGTIETHHAGYLLRVGTEDLDLLVFDELVERARATADPTEAAGRLRDALALWRGPALAGLGGALLEREAAGLEERRLATLAECLDLELAAGQYARLVPELSRLVAEHPLRERFVGQWMLALHRTGRQGEALEAYQQLRRRLVDELGVEPGSDLQELHRAVLGGDPPRPAPTVRAPANRAPRQLPNDVPAFTGREAELARLVAELSAAAGGGPVVISAIRGAGGIGKSALAVHVAHRLVQRFPDGQLYVDLQGAAAGLRPLEPVEVLGRFLRALGVEGSRVPTEVGEAAALFRSELAARRVLVVLDNARDAAQVAPLVPGSAGCAVLVTSRRALTGLDGARSVQLDVLSPAEAVLLLGRLAGAERVAAESQAAAAVACWCGYLPLALRIAGARLAARPAWPVRALADRLADAGRRLNELELPDLGVRASLSVSRQELRDSAEPVDQAAARGFAALAIADGAELGVPAAARLLEQPDPLAERILERLVDANLLDTAAPGRYRLHDLLRLYGRELADKTSSPAQRGTALTRAFGFYTATAWQTLGLLRPGDYRLGRADPRWTGDALELPDAHAALGWLETERPNLLAAVAQIASGDAGVPVELAVQLTQAMFGLFRVRGYWSDAVAVNELALAVATELGDRPAVAALRIDLGAALGQQERLPDALACLSEAIALHRELDDRQGEAAGLINLGVIYQMMARYDDALGCYQRSLAINEDLDNLRGQAMSLANLATINRRKNRHDEALSLHQRSLAIYAKLGDRYAQAVGLVNLGVLYEAMHRYPDAEACLQESRAIYHEMGDRYGESETITDLGILHRKQGRYELALTLQQQALANCRELGRREGQAVNLLEQGITLQALGRHQQARACWQESLTLFEQLNSQRVHDVRALLAG